MNKPTFQTRFEHRFNETDLTQRNWVEDLSIDSVFEELKKEFIHYKNTGKDDWFADLLVRQHFYCSATAPYDMYVFEYSDLEEILNSVKAGDILEIWSLIDKPKYYRVNCPKYYRVNCPNKDGLFPTKGAY